MSRRRFLLWEVFCTTHGAEGVWKDGHGGWRADAPVWGGRVGGYGCTGSILIHSHGVGAQAGDRGGAGRGFECVNRRLKKSKAIGYINTNATYM